MRREIYASYDLTFPKIPGKRVMFSQEDGSSKIEVEVFASGESVPEWSAVKPRLESAIAAVHKQYGSSGPVRDSSADENEDH